MRYLLDTNVLIFAAANPEAISEKAMSAIRNRHAEFALSTGSIWEMSIKTASKKLELGMSLQRFVTQAKKIYDLTIIPARLTHFYRASLLPFYHGDPFDRLIIAQAQLLNATIITSDKIIPAYDVQTLW